MDIDDNEDGGEQSAATAVALAGHYDDGDPQSTRGGRQTATV